MYLLMGVPLLIGGLQIAVFGSEMRGGVLMGVCVCKKKTFSNTVRNAGVCVNGGGQIDWNEDALEM